MLMSTAGKLMGAVKMAADTAVNAMPIFLNRRKKGGVGDPALSTTSFISMVLRTGIVDQAIPVDDWW